MTERVRIVIDTNIIASALLGGRVTEQFAILIDNTRQLDIVYDDQLMAEIRNLAHIPYFQQKGIQLIDIEKFLVIYQSIAIKVVVTAQVRMGRDRKDHFLLSLCRDAHAQFLISGDYDLLTIGAYGSAKIVTLSEFINTLPTLIIGS